jgi:hypothetical protein
LHACLTPPTRPQAMGDKGRKGADKKGDLHARIDEWQLALRQQHAQLAGTELPPADVGAAGGAAAAAGPRAEGDEEMADAEDGQGTGAACATKAGNVAKAADQRRGVRGGGGGRPAAGRKPAPAGKAGVRRKKAAARAADSSDEDGGGSSEGGQQGGSDEDLVLSSSENEGAGVRLLQLLLLGAGVPVAAAVRGGAGLPWGAGSCSRLEAPQAWLKPSGPVCCRARLRRSTTCQPQPAALMPTYPLPQAPRDRTRPRLARPGGRLLPGSSWEGPLRRRRQPSRAAGWRAAAGLRSRWLMAASWRMTSRTTWRGCCSDLGLAGGGQQFIVAGWRAGASATVYWCTQAAV